jgi:hypothetical protein
MSLSLHSLEILTSKVMVSSEGALGDDEVMRVDSS